MIVVAGDKDNRHMDLLLHKPALQIDSRFAIQIDIQDDTERLLKVAMI